MKKILLLSLISGFWANAQLTSWNFDDNTVQNWSVQGGITTLAAANGTLQITPTANSNFPTITNLTNTVDAITYKAVRIKLRNQSNYNQIRFRCNATATVVQTINNSEAAGAAFSTYEIDLSTLTTWDTASETAYEIRFSKNPAGGGTASLIEIDEITFLTALGTESHSYIAFKAYPNPVKDVLTIDTQSKISSVDIFNINGQKVSTNNTILNNQIQLTELNSGVYFAKVTYEGGQTGEIKFIKE